MQVQSTAATAAADVFQGRYRGAIPNVDFTPRAFAGFKSEAEYKAFFEKSIKPYRNTQGTSYVDMSYENTLSRFLEVFGDVKHTTGGELMSIYYVITGVCEGEEDSTVVFTGNTVNYGVENKSQIEISPPLGKITHGFKCKWLDFQRFLIWNILRDPEYWVVYSQYVIAENEFTKSIHTLMSVFVWGNPRVKINEMFEYHPDFASGDIDTLMLMELRKENLRSQMERCMKSFLLGTHPRVGENSPIQTLCFDVIEMIRGYVVSVEK
jgi:hypothetical protein